MQEALSVLRQVREALSQLRVLDFEIPEAGFVIFAALCAFGVLNCLLGYRLLRFWMMFVGFGIGALLGYALCRYVGIPGELRTRYLLAMGVAGVGISLVTFFYYRIGIFLMAFALGGVVSIYIIYPNSSALFYLCLLIGAGLGLLAFRFEREIIIVITSVFGGVLAGYCGTKLLELKEMPYGIFFAAAFGALGLVIQFYTNPRGKGQPFGGGQGEREKREKQGDSILSAFGWRSRENLENDAFYERYLDGRDVFDSDEEPESVFGGAGAELFSEEDPLPPIKGGFGKKARERKEARKPRPVEQEAERKRRAGKPRVDRDARPSRSNSQERQGRQVVNYPIKPRKPITFDLKGKNTDQEGREALKNLKKR